MKSLVYNSTPLNIKGIMLKVKNYVMQRSENPQTSHDYH